MKFFFNLLFYHPLFYTTYKNQTIIQKIQPDIKKIQHDHKHNKEKQAQALFELYRQHKINPFSGFFLILIQLPILIALYQVFLKGFSPELFSNLYSFIAAPDFINHTFLGLLDLTKPAIVITALAAGAQYLQGRMSIRSTAPNQEISPQERIGRQMVFIGPIFTLVILYSLPAAVGLYWLTTSAFSVTQQFLINRSLLQNGNTSIANQNIDGVKRP